MSHLQEAAFGAGCFWGVEDRFRVLPGVVMTEVGYMGGKTDHPTYDEVCSDDSGHAEVVHLQFDPDKIHYEQLLDLFWRSHNPTTLNRQGPDEGSQYRSVIFTYSDEQARLAEASKIQLAESHRWPNPIVTEIVSAPAFHRAEEYHQQYHLKHGGSCAY
jgi:peptide-methionine (S)-S-oxide reductase